MSHASRVPLTHHEVRGAAALATAPQDLTSARKLANSVPVFTPMQKGNLLVEYTERGNRLIFHIYHVERKRLVAEALQEASQSPDNPRRLAQLDDQLTEHLSKYPWWGGIGEKLQHEFSSFFRETPKVVFDPEVDSWSVVVAKPILPTAWTATAQDMLMSRLFSQLS